MGTEKNRLGETVLLRTTTFLLLLKRENGDVNFSIISYNSFKSRITDKSM